MSLLANCKWRARRTLWEGLGSALRQHLDQLLLPLQQVKADEPHFLFRRRILEAQDHRLSGFVKGSTGWQMLRSLTFDFQHRLTLGNVAEDRTGMLVQAGLLTGLKNNFPYVNRGHGLIPDSSGQERNAGKLQLAHAGFR